MANVIKHKRGSGSDPSASDLILGELAIRTDTGKLFTKMDSGAIAEIAGGGSDIAINTLSSSSATGGGSATFNGSAYRFTLSAPPSVSAQQLLVSINGVIQKPVAGTGQPSEGFSVDGTDIILGDAPATGSDFFILTFKSLGVSEPADNSVTSAKIVDGAIVNADINASAAIDVSKLSGVLPLAGGTLTGNLTISRTNPRIIFTDTDNNPDYLIDVQAGHFLIYDSTNTTNRLLINSDGHIDLLGNVDISSGLDVTGAITATDNITITSSHPKLLLTDNSDPDFSVHVNDSAFHIRNETNTRNDFRITSDGTNELYHGGSLKLKTVSGGIDVTGAITGTGDLTIDTNTLHVDSSNNRVGIGTTSPTHMLDISGSNPILALNDTDTTNDRFRLTYNGGSTQLQVDPNNVRSGSHLLVAVDGTERMRIDSDGRLLHGVTSSIDVCSVAPSRLQIHNNASVLTASFTGYGAHSGGSIIALGKSRSSTVGDATGAVSNGDTLGDIRFGGSDGTDMETTACAIRGEVDGSVSSNTIPGRLVFRTNSGSGSAEHMRIDSSGNVGIGTTSPNQLLEVANSSGGATISISTDEQAGSQASKKYNNLDFTGYNNNVMARIQSWDESSSTGHGYLTFFTNKNGVGFTEKLRIDPDGNVGIGTTSPSSFDNSADDLVISTSGNTGITINSGSAGSTSEGNLVFAEGTAGSQDKFRGAIQYKHGEDRFSFYTNNSERMRIDSAGRLMIGTTTEGHSNADDLTVNNSGNCGITIRSGSSSDGNIFFSDDTSGNGETKGVIKYKHADDALVFNSNGNERMRLDSSGNLLFNRTETTISSSSHGFVLLEENNNSVFFLHSREANGTHNTAEFYGLQGAFKILGDGDVQNTNNSYGQLSDVTLKQDIVDASSQWDDIKAIRVRKFRFKDNPTGDLQIGVVAQELETVSPKLVTEVATSSIDTNSTERVKAVKYSVLYMKAIKALQEAQVRIETLETKVEALEAK